MTPRPSLDQFRQHVLQRVGTPKSDLAGSYHLALCVLYFYFHRAWMDRHIEPAKIPAGYLWPALEGQDNRELHMIRAIDLAEMLFNCQLVPNFGSFVRRARTEPDLESVVAELRVARYLMLARTPFRFHDPTGKLTESFDLMVKTAANLHSPADTKAKVIGRALTDSTIKDSLNRARSQLPPGQAGLIFLHVNPEWIIGTSGIALGVSEPSAMDALLEPLSRRLNDLIPSFFRSTTRVLAVIVLGQALIDKEGRTWPTEHVIEFVNPTHSRRDEYPPEGLIRPCGGEWISLLVEGLLDRYIETGKRIGHFIIRLSK